MCLQSDCRKTWLIIRETPRITNLGPKQITTLTLLEKWGLSYQVKRCVLTLSEVHPLHPWIDLRRVGRCGTSPLLTVVVGRSRRTRSRRCWRSRRRGTLRNCRRRRCRPSGLLLTRHWRWGSWWRPSTSHCRPWRAVPTWSWRWCSHCRFPSRHVVWVRTLLSGRYRGAASLRSSPSSAQILRRTDPCSWSWVCILTAGIARYRVVVE